MQITTNYVLQVEEKLYNSNKTCLELLEQVRELDTQFRDENTRQQEEITKLTSVNYQLRLDIKELTDILNDVANKMQFYVPVKTDAIDLTLSDYINNYPDKKKLKIMFMRESEGVYQFGQRKVNVRVERGKIMIKVGGGYLSIDEFLDQYTPAELAAFERQDPLLRFSAKVAIQKTVGDKDAYETSPIRRSPSPKKRRAI